MIITEIPGHPCYGLRLVICANHEVLDVPDADDGYAVADEAACAAEKLVDDYKKNNTFHDWSGGWCRGMDLHTYGAAADIYYREELEPDPDLTDFVGPDDEPEYTPWVRVPRDEIPDDVLAAAEKTLDAIGCAANAEAERRRAAD